MTPSRIILALSLAANVVLAALVWRTWTTTSHDINEPVKPGSVQAVPASAETPSGGKLPLAPSRRGAKAGNTWRELERTDLRTLQARLRAAGFPEKSVRLILATMLENEERMRRNTLIGDALDTPYWQSRIRAPLDDKSTSKAILDLKLSMELKRRELFGVDAELPDDDIDRAVYRRQHGDLPPEKAAMLADLSREFARRWIEMRNPNEPPTTASIERSLAEMRAYRAAVEKSLTPAELEQFDLRTSSTAAYLRHALNLAYTNVTEDEYRLIYRLYEPQVQQREQAAMRGNPEQLQAFEDAAQRAMEQLKLQLSPERYAEIAFASAKENVPVLNLVSRLGLPVESAHAVASVRQDIADRARGVRADASLTSDQQNAKLAELAAEARTKVGQILGTRGLEGYKDDMKKWLPAPTH